MGIRMNYEEDRDKIIVAVRRRANPNCHTGMRTLAWSCGKGVYLAGDDEDTFEFYMIY